VSLPVSTGAPFTVARPTTATGCADEPSNTPLSGPWSISPPAPSIPMPTTGVTAEAAGGAGGGAGALGSLGSEM
jgi:hypothetical protein